MKQRIINITIVGTEGQLDINPTEFDVKYLKDSLEAATKEVLDKYDEYGEYGYTHIVSIKEEVI